MSSFTFFVNFCAEDHFLIFIWHFIIRAMLIACVILNFTDIERKRVIIFILPELCLIVSNLYSLIIVYQLDIFFKILHVCWVNWCRNTWTSWHNKVPRTFGTCCIDTVTDEFALVAVARFNLQIFTKDIIYLPRCCLCGVIVTLLILSLLAAHREHLMEVVFKLLS